MTDDFPTADHSTVVRPTNAPSPRSKPGDTIGRYIIREVLGEGGFGVVYRAEQTQPVKRMVALKVIKPGMDTDSVVARFEAERQALAVMDHPGVAKVFDGGVTEQGRPYFAMELVDGIPITDYCDRRQLSIAERVSLFQHVCNAVQHAHSKGIIHRDLKPSNILVATEGSTSVPKVIDFGIAKALNQRLTDAPLATQIGQLLGTPAYMSPEQADVSTLDIDTRSDVYSLGVVLYELLTGHRPFEPSELHRVALDEIQRLIREVDPPKPSTRYSTGSDSERVASDRRTASRGLTGMLRRDLDWVVMKCLEKERARRYASASDLEAELGRFLSNQPVIAGPPSVSYKVSKFIRRHRAGVAVAAVLAATITLGLAGTIAGLARAAEAESAARREAVRKLDAADFLTRKIITEISPYETGPDTKAIQLIDAAADRIQQDLAGDPLTEAIVRQALGVAYRDLGSDEKGRTQLNRAVALFDGLAGTREDAALEAALARLDLAGTLWRLGEGNRAQSLAEDALTVIDARLGPDDPRTLFGRAELASAMKYAGDAAASEAIYREVLDIARTAPVDDDWRTTQQYNLALAVQAQGRAAEAEQMFTRLLEQQNELFGPGSAVAVRTRSELASCYARLQRWNDAEETFLNVIPDLIDVFGPDHPRTVEATANRGIVAVRRGEPALGATLLQDALDRLVRGSTWSHPNAVAITRQLARVHVIAGDIPAAIAAYDTAIAAIEGSSLNPQTASERTSQLACAAVETFTDVDDAVARKYERRCSP